MSAVATLPVSTASERGFSKRKIICSPLGTTRTLPHMSSMMLLSIVAPPVTEWNPLPYAKACIGQGRRNAKHLGWAERLLSQVRDATGAAGT